MFKIKSRLLSALESTGSRTGAVEVCFSVLPEIVVGTFISSSVSIKETRTVGCSETSVYYII